MGLIGHTIICEFIVTLPATFVTYMLYADTVLAHNRILIIFCDVLTMLSWKRTLRIIWMRTVHLIVPRQQKVEILQKYASLNHYPVVCYFFVCEDIVTA